MTDIILMTGATGFLGTELAARLTRTSQSKLYALVRAAGEAEAYHRLRAAWCHDKGLYQAIGAQIVPVPGDFTKPNLGLEEPALRTLEDSVTLVLHAGAEIGFQKSKQELQAANYDGTKNMLSIAAKMGKLRRFVHISTAYVAGQKSGTVLEEEPAGTAFSTLYEESKASAESLVRESALPFSICRPGKIVGDSRSGWIRSFMRLCQADSQRLYREAYALGSRIRRFTGFTDSGDLRRLALFLYRNIGIRMDGSIPGEVTVSSCYFSRFYTPEQCALMSFVDSGVIAGLWGGGELKFTGRITEGCENCAAVFRRDNP